MMRWLYLGIALYLIALFSQVVFQSIKLKNLETECKRDIVEAERLNHNLKVQLQKMQNPVYLEILSRQKLGMVKKDELVVKVIEEGKKD